MKAFNTINYIEVKLLKKNKLLFYEKHDGTRDISFNILTTIGTDGINGSSITISPFDLSVAEKIKYSYRGIIDIELSIGYVLNENSVFTYKFKSTSIASEYNDSVNTVTINFTNMVNTEKKNTFEISSFDVKKGDTLKQLIDKLGLDVSIDSPIFFKKDTTYVGTPIIVLFNVMEQFKLATVRLPNTNKFKIMKAGSKSHPIVHKNQRVLVFDIKKGHILSIPSAESINEITVDLILDNRLTLYSNIVLKNIKAPYLSNDTKNLDNTQKDIYKYILLIKSVEHSGSRNDIMKSTCVCIKSSRISK